MAAVIHGLISGVLPARCQREAGACGAGAAGSESQPYLEGGIEAADLSGGGAGWVARGRRVGRPGLQGAAGSERRPYV